MISYINRKYRGLVYRKRAFLAALRENKREVVFQNRGKCPICEKEVTFIAHDPWLRDHYRCSSCGSIPRQRALMDVIDSYFPHWRDLKIHESSPGPGGASKRLARECKQYLATQYYSDQAPGAMLGKVRCENLEALTFADASFDLHITQDVLEHVFHPEKVFREIARTLKPGGAHIFTVPLVNRFKPSKRRAAIDAAGQIQYLEVAEYHGNPISSQGSLVTMDWGFDICAYIFECSGLFTHVIKIDDLSKGIRAEYIEVLLSYKPQEDMQSAGLV